MTAQRPSPPAESRPGTFLIEYHHNGRVVLASLHADNWKDAQQRCSAIGYSGRVIGSSVMQFPANDATAFPLRLAMPLLTWWKNWRARE